MANKKQLATIRSLMTTRRELLIREKRLYFSLISMSLQIIMIRTLYQPLNDAANVAHFNAYYEHIRQSATKFAPYPDASFDDLLKAIEESAIEGPKQYEGFHIFRELLNTALYGFYHCDGTFGKPNDMLQSTLRELNQKIETNREACLKNLGFLVEIMKPIQEVIPIEQFRPLVNFITFAIGPTFHFILQPLLTHCYFQLKNRDKLLINVDENFINRHDPKELINKLNSLNKETETSINNQKWYLRRVSGALFLLIVLGYMLGKNAFSSEIIMIAVGMLTTASVNIIEDGKQVYDSFCLSRELDKRKAFLKNALGGNLKSIETHKEDFLHSSYLVLNIMSSHIPTYKVSKIIKNCLQKHGISVLGFGKNYIIVAGDAKLNSKQAEVIKSQIANAIRIDNKAHLLGNELNQIAECLNIVCPSEFLKESDNLRSLKFSLNVPEAYLTFVNVQTLKNIFPKNAVEGNKIITITGIEPCSDKNKLAQLIAAIKSKRLNINQNLSDCDRSIVSTQTGTSQGKRKQRIKSPRNIIQSASGNEPTPIESAPPSTIADNATQHASNIMHLHIPALNNNGETTETIELEDGVRGCLGFDLDYAKRKSSKVVFYQSRDILFGLKYAASRFGDSGILSPKTHTVNAYTIKIKGTTGMFRVKSDMVVLATGECVVMFNSIKNDK